MRGLPLVVGGAVIGSGPDQRVPELKRPPADRHQTLFLGRLQFGEIQPGTVQQCQVAGIVGRGKQQADPGGTGKRPDLVAERVDHPAGHRHRSAGCIRPGYHAGDGQLDERERVAAGGRDELVALPWR